jgi:hypothetical protein
MADNYARLNLEPPMVIAGDSLEAKRQVFGTNGYDTPANPASANSLPGAQPALMSITLVAREVPASYL